MLMLDQLKERNGQSATLGSLEELNPGRETLFNVGISLGNPVMEITHFERIGLNGLFSDPFNLTREYAVEREKKEQPIGACPYHTFVSSLLCFSPFSLLFLRSLFSFSFFVSFLSCDFSHLFFLPLSDCLFLFLLLPSLCIAKAFLYCLL